MIPYLKVSKQTYFGGGIMMWSKHLDKLNTELNHKLEKSMAQKRENTLKMQPENDSRPRTRISAPRLRPKGYFHPSSPFA